MNSISKYQLAALLLITDTFSLFCISGSISLSTLHGMLSASAVGFLMSLVYTAHGGNSSRAQRGLFLVYSVFCGGTIFSSLWRTRDVIYIPYEEELGVWGRLITAGLIALVCIYGCSTGIRAVSRAAVIAVVAGIVCIVIDFGSAVFSSDWENVSRPEDRSFAYEFVRGFALSGSIGNFFVLIEKVKGNRSSAAAVYFGTKAVLATLVLLTVLPVAGGIMSITRFPVIMAAQLSQPFDAQRIDSLFLVVFVVFAVFAVTLQAMTGAYLMRELFPGFHRWRSSAVMVLMIGAALLISGRELILLRGAAAAGIMVYTAVKTKNYPLHKSADK
ncbi:hypothetical protein [Ruminococcus sp.]|uniref:hypothetical protein n=1 Tax=Ruminococcus sp. TaxID=41978 RepID=UPI001B539251|nr:hypothetical protein [Ruminococcus sp.]MBP5433428.1 hypothetical protein [Ruminococcus sp.]